jgi:hypothetical protein
MFVGYSLDTHRKKLLRFPGGNGENDGEPKIVREA